MASEMITINVGSKPPMKAKLCRPPGTKMGLIVLQEWWGMNEQIQDEAAQIATEGGFITLVPDLYRGKLAINNEEANHYMSELDWQGAIQDIKECAKYLLENGANAVGATGFCMGGALSMAAAGLVDEVSAAAPFYGICGDGLCDPSTIKKPLQCHFGSKDAVPNFSDPAAQEKLKKKLIDGGVKHEFHVYEGAGHAFTHKGGPLETYSEEFTKQAFDRMFDFFKKELGGGRK